MPHALTPRRPAPPPLWTAFVMTYLRASEDLARRLWEAYEPAVSLTVRWQLEQTMLVPRAENIAHLATLVTPQALMDAAEQLCVPGRLRRRELIDLEEAILQGTTKEGTWR
jgi:hypothetical protein